MAQQEAALAQAEVTLPPLQKALAQQRNLLATLIGRLPSDRVAERFELSDLTLPSDLPLSLPSRLVEQRPDIRAAEANLHSASAAVGVAIANQFPQITLTAGVSTQSGALDQLFLPGLGASTIGASVLQTVLDGGALAAKKKAAQAQLEQADAQYRSTVLTAFRNVADTLRALEYDAMALQAAVASERAAATSFTIARRRLELGDTTYVIVLLAELTYQQALAGPRPGAGQPLHRHGGALPGAGRRLVESRRRTLQSRPEIDVPATQAARRPAQDRRAQMTGEPPCGVGRQAASGC